MFISVESHFWELDLLYQSYFNAIVNFGIHEVLRTQMLNFVKTNEDILMKLSIDLAPCTHNLDKSHHLDLRSKFEFLGRFSIFSERLREPHDHYLFPKKKL